MGKEFKITSSKDGIRELYQYYKEHLNELDTEAIRLDQALKFCKTK